MVSAPSLATDVAPRFRISVTQETGRADAGWLAEVDGLEGCTARGATAEEAIRRAWAAAEAAIEETEDGEGGEQRRRTGRHSGKLLVRMPSTLHGELAAAAEHEGVSLNQLITGALAAAVDWRTSGEQHSRAAVPDRLPRRLLVANLVALALVAAVAVALLLVAWRNGV